MPGGQDGVGEKCKDLFLKQDKNRIKHFKSVCSFLCCYLSDFTFDKKVLELLFNGICYYMITWEVRQ